MSEERRFDGGRQVIIRSIHRGAIMRLPSHYRRCLNYPFSILAVVLTLCGLALYHARDFTFDASADTLISKSDPELAFFRKVSDRFGDTPFLVLTYTPLE
ncbi:MAG: hypothetical protein ACE1ZA_02355, partial [Pseudomonadales bacterium]